jgi:acetyl esterase/lipase
MSTSTTSTDNNIPTRPSWSPQQAAAAHAIRQRFANFVLPSGTALSEAERAAVPTTGVPPGLAIRSVLVPPADGLPPALLDGRIVPSPVPAFFYSLEDASAKSAEPPRTCVVLWIHGGGNVLNSPTAPQFLPKYKEFLDALGEGYVIFAPAYRLATVPENTFPANIQDVFSAFIYLIREGYDPENITIGGESSGGNSGESDLV